MSNTDLFDRITKLKDAFREANQGMSPTKLWLDEADTRALKTYQAEVDKLPVKVLALEITENAPETKVG